MRDENIKNIINEIIEKSKDFDEGFFPPKENKIKITELENFDFIIFSELEKIIKVLFSKKDNYSNKKETFSVPLIKIENDYIVFYPSLIKEFQKEINQ